MIRTTVEFQALEYPLPDAAREKLAKLGKAACEAREKAGHSAIVTKEGSALAEFEAGLRTPIGVLHRREWLGSRAL